MSGRDPQPTIAVRVARKVSEGEHLASFELVAADGRPLPSYGPGAHVDIHLPGGIVRQYSLSGPPGAAHYQVCVLRATPSRGGSEMLHASIAQGDTLRIGLPRNQFPLRHEARHSVLLAAGIGITPIIAMAEDLAARGASFELHYGARSLASAAFVARVRALAAQRAQLHLSAEPGSGRMRLEAILTVHVAGTHLYVCGPAPFVSEAMERARARGWPDEALHHEAFAPEQTAAGAAFRVHAARSGRMVAVAPQETIVQALGRIGVQLETSCEQGICGTCLTRVLAGTPEHRDQYLTAEERAAGDVILACCSRAAGAELVLDV